MLEKALLSDEEGWFCNDRYHKQMTRNACAVCVEALDLACLLGQLLDVPSCGSRSCCKLFIRA